MKTLNILALSSLMTLVACVADDSDELALGNTDDAEIVNYYGDVATMNDLEGMEVHCIASARGALDCFDTTDERDALVTKAGWCHFYEHVNYGGSSIIYGAGSRISFVGSSWNDRFSSLKCSGATTRVYEHINYGGDSRYFSSGNVSWIGNLWNDEISSLRVY